MNKVFISQPMQGKTDEEIRQTIQMDTEFIKTVYPDAEIIDSFMPESAPKNSRTGVYKLGQSIQLLAGADVLFLSKGWDKARGCQIEHSVAVAYGIKCHYSY